MSNKRKILMISALIGLFSTAIVVILCLSFTIKKNKEAAVVYNKDGSVTLGEGYTAHGFYNDKTGKIIDNGSLYNVENGLLHGEVVYEQNLLGKQNYLLILLIDYEQCKFEVRNQMYESYAFQLEGKEKINIPIHIKLENENAKEMEYIIVREPAVNHLSIDTSEEWTKYMITKDFCAWRIILKENAQVPEKSKDFKIWEPDVKMQMTAHLVADCTNLTVMPECNSYDKYDLMIAGMQGEDTDFAAIAFADWKQVSFENGKKVQYVTVPDGKSIVISGKIPNSDTVIPYQIFIFPKPYNNNSMQIISPFATFRTIVYPNEGGNEQVRHTLHWPES